MKEFLLLLFCIIISSCSSGLSKIEIELGSEIVSCEVAVTPEERQQGLMDRKELGELEAMLFVFPDSKNRSFWMHNTLIPLSIAYIDKQGIILNIEDMEPLDTSPVKSRGPAQFAIEMNKGAFTRLGVEQGDYIEIPKEFY